MMQVGFVGLGRMGQAMVPRLLDAGYPVAVWNRTPAKAQPLLERGALLAETLGVLPATCDIVFTILTDDTAVEAVYNPADGLLSGKVGGTLFVEMSTIRPDTIRRVATLAAERGASLLDSPVSGTVAPARAGQLMALVGGSADDLERARPLLEVLCRRIAHLGATGSGTTMKLVLNMPMAVYWQALAESLAMGAQAGLAIEQMLNLIADSPAAIGALPAKIAAILQQSNEAPFNVAGVRKDLLAMVATGQLSGVPTPAASAALLSFAAATAAGWGERDLAEIVPYYIEMVQQTPEQR
jgi:3-hydroxyisobutyrate dehydrogenase-like beta-hydroxyacid dehydrogenase